MCYISHTVANSTTSFRKLIYYATTCAVKYLPDTDLAVFTVPETAFCRRLLLRIVKRHRRDDEMVQHNECQVFICRFSVVSVNITCVYTINDLSGSDLITSDTNHQTRLVNSTDNRVLCSVESNMF